MVEKTQFALGDTVIMYHFSNIKKNGSGPLLNNWGGVERSIVKRIFNLLNLDNSSV